MAYTPYQPYGVYGLQPYQAYSPPQRYDIQPYSAMQAQQGVAQPFPGQGNMQQQPAQNGFICRPVTSREEALGVQVEYLSAGTIMPDLGHSMIYIKRFDPNSGLSNLFEFALVQPQQQEGPSIAAAPAIPDYSDTFQAFSEQLVSISDRIGALTEKLETWKPETAGKKGGGKE